MADVIKNRPDYVYIAEGDISNYDSSKDILYVFGMNGAPFLQKTMLMLRICVDILKGVFTIIGRFDIDQFHLACVELIIEHTESYSIKHGRMSSQIGDLCEKVV